MPDQPYPHRWKALAVLALSLLIVTVDNTILNVALPTIRSDLGASSSDLQWIVDSYLLVFAGLLLAAGSLGIASGRKKALFAGMSIFGLGSLLAALSGGATELIASRALMGVGVVVRDHADDPLHSHQHLPRGRAPQGDRDVGGGVRARDRHRPHLGRLADRALRLEQHLPRQPAGAWRRA